MKEIHDFKRIMLDNNYILRYVNNENNIYIKYEHQDDENLAITMMTIEIDNVIRYLVKKTKPNTYNCIFEFNTNSISELENFIKNLGGEQ